MPRTLCRAQVSTCPLARAEQQRSGGAAGYLVVHCNAEPGCRSVWYDPPHEPGKQQAEPGTAVPSDPAVDRDLRVGRERSP